MADTSEMTLEKIFQALLSPDMERVKLAMKLSVKMKNHDLNRVIAWKLGDSNNIIVQTAEEIIRDNYEIFKPILFLELQSPKPVLRKKVINIFGDYGELKDLPEFLHLLKDIKIDVRESVRQVISNIVKNYAEKLHKAPESVDKSRLNYVIKVLYALAEFPEISIRTVAIDWILEFGFYSGPICWEDFSEKSDQFKMNLKHECFRLSSRIPVLEFIYDGFLSEYNNVQQYTGAILELSIDNRTIKYHAALFSQLPEDRVMLIAERLHKLNLFQFYINLAHAVNDKLREVLFRMLGMVPVAHYRNSIDRFLDSEVSDIIVKSINVLREHDFDYPVERLEELLNHGDDDVVIAAINYFGDKEDFEYISLILPLLSHDSPSVALAAAHAVLRIGKPRLLQKYGQLGETAREVLLQVFQKLDQNFLRKLAREMPNLNPNERIRVIQILVHQQDVGELERMVDKLVDDDDEKVRATAARAVGALPAGSKQTELLSKLMEDKDIRVQANAIEELPDSISPEIIERLRDLIRKSPARVKAAALKKLWEIGMSEFEISIVYLLEDPDLSNRISMIWLLGEIEAPHLLDVVVDYLEDPEPLIRAEAIRTLGKKASIDTIRRLTPMLDDEDFQVRHAVQSVIRERLNLEYLIKK